MFGAPIQNFDYATSTWGGAMAFNPRGVGSNPQEVWPLFTVYLDNIVKTQLPRTLEFYNTKLHINEFVQYWHHM